MTPKETRMLQESINTLFIIILIVTSHVTEKQWSSLDKSSSISRFQ